MYHPINYKKNECSLKDDCDLKYCPYYHNLIEFSDYENFKQLLSREKNSIFGLI